MTKEETKSFLKTMLSVYPDFKLTDHSVAAWQMFFSKESPEVLLAALKAHGLESKWPPTVAELNAIIEQGRQPKGSNWTAAEALQWVQTLAANYSKMSEQEKQRARLECPKLTKDTLRLVGFERFLPPPPYQYNGWVTPKNIEPPPVGLFIKTYEQLQSKEIEVRKVERLSSTERKLLNNVNDTTGGKLNKFLN